MDQHNPFIGNDNCFLNKATTKELYFDAIFLSMYLIYKQYTKIQM